jgi:hypothetical protein
MRRWLHRNVPSCIPTTSSPLYSHLRTCPRVYVWPSSLSDHGLAYATAVAIFRCLGMFSPTLLPPPYLLLSSCASLRWSPLFLSAYLKMAPSQCPNLRRLCCLSSRVTPWRPIWSAIVLFMETSSCHRPFHCRDLNIEHVDQVDILSPDPSTLRSICFVGNKTLLLYLKVLKDFYISKFHKSTSIQQNLLPTTYTPVHLIRS